MQARHAPASQKERRSFFRYAPLDHAVAGLGAGFITTLCLHPLDLVKTRFQGVLGDASMGRWVLGNDIRCYCFFFWFFFFCVVQDALPVGRIRYRNTWHAFTNIVQVGEQCVLVG